MLTTRIIKNDSLKSIKLYLYTQNYYNIKSNKTKDIKTEWIKVHGQLCPDLGLKAGQSVNEQTFTNLLLGKDASGIQRTRKHKVHGIDLTFSAPKSVSIAALVTDRVPAITQAHDAAVLETMKEIEAKHSVARPTATTKTKTDKMVYVTVRNGLSNSLDPHLHTHAIVMNITRGEKTNDKIMGIHTKEILKHGFNIKWGKIYRNKLLLILKQLGYEISYTKKGMWRLDIISQETEYEFSQRVREIEKTKARGNNSFSAWRITRKNKQPDYSIEIIQAIWNKRIKGTNTNGTYF